MSSKNGDRAMEVVDRIEELTLRLEAIDLGTDEETAKLRLEAARANPERPSAEEISGKLDLRSIPWLRDESSEGDAA